MAIPGAARGPLRATCDVVVIGAGIQGLALAYELAKRGVDDVVVVDAGYPGCGSSGRNGEMIRSAFSSSEWTAFFDVSLGKWHGLSDELDFNVLFTPAGHLSVVDSEEAMRNLREQYELDRELGLQMELLSAAQVREHLPDLNPDFGVGGLLQHGGGFAHHDAVLWGYAQAADRLGVEIHPFTAVTGLELADGTIESVTTTRGRIATHTVVNAAGGDAPEVAAFAGVEIPTVTWRVQALVTESLRPFLRPAVSLKPLLGYCHQTTRGEFVGGSEQKVMHPSRSIGVGLGELRDTCQKMVHAFPRLAAARVVRAWSGIVDVTPDFAPILDRAPGVDGLWLDCGWIYGFMGAPGGAVLLAEAIDTGQIPEVMRPFTLDRFSSGRLLEDNSLVVMHS